MRRCGLARVDLGLRPADVLVRRDGGAAENVGAESSGVCAALGLCVARLAM
jgi:hypothetical protein